MVYRRYNKKAKETSFAFLSLKSGKYLMSTVFHLWAFFGVFLMLCSEKICCSEVQPIGL